MPRYLASFYDNAISYRRIDVAVNLDALVNLMGPTNLDQERHWQVFAGLDLNADQVARYT